MMITAIGMRKGHRRREMDYSVCSSAGCRSPTRRFFTPWACSACSISNEESTKAANLSLSQPAKQPSSQIQPDHTSCTDNNKDEIDVALAGLPIESSAPETSYFCHFRRAFVGRSGPGHPRFDARKQQLVAARHAICALRQANVRGGQIRRHPLLYITFAVTHITSSGGDKCKCLLRFRHTEEATAVILVAALQLAMV